MWVWWGVHVRTGGVGCAGEDWWCVQVRTSGVGCAGED